MYGGIALVLILIFAILQVWQLRQRRKLEAALVVVNDRLHLALEAGHSVGWDLDLTTGMEKWFGDLPTMFGMPGTAYSGHVEDFYRRVHPEDRQLVRNAGAEARRHRSDFAAEFRVVREDGAVRWVASRGKCFYEGSVPARMRGIAVDITKRKLAEEAFKKSQENFSKAFLLSPMALTITSVRENRYLEVNDAFEQVSGWKRSEIIGKTPAELGLWNDLKQRDNLVARLQAGEAVRDFEFRATRRTGEARTALGSAVLVEMYGEPCVLSVAADITDLKRAEATLRESEERFRLVANTAPVMIWMSGVDKLYTYVNRPWLEFTGRTLDQEIGDGWAQGIHQNDLERCMETYSHSFDKRKPFEMEYQHRRADGEFRWVFDVGVPRFNADGSFAGYIGSVIDVTQLKLAEEALSLVSRRLIEAQEEERARIGRELHDDIAQRLCLVVLNLERSRLGLSNSEVSDAIGQAVELVTEIATDTQALSHRLHSSKLEIVGLIPAARGYCRELSEQRDVTINFYTEMLPLDLPLEISLCLLRVLQEALQNGIKHSGSRRFQVSFKVEPAKIHLLVSDSGKGFDAVQSLKGRGLGISSMRERMKLVNGHLWIDSRPAQGTTVHACVPMTFEAEFAVGMGT